MVPQFDERTTTAPSSTDTSSDIRDRALRYAQSGWKVLPIASHEKRPVITRWQEQASCDPLVIADWWNHWPDANVGLLLGEGSGVIDIECDSPDAEEVLKTLFDGELPSTPTYKSTRGCHRLFEWTPELPFPGKAVFKIGPQKSLEIRTGNGGKGAQSLLPPSIHPTGAQYVWLPGLSPDDVTVGELPHTVLEKLAAGEGVSSTKATKASLQDVRAAIDALGPHADMPYEDWLKVGMALHYFDPSNCSEWVNWSAKGVKFTTGECEAKWESFTHGGGTTISTLFHIADRYAGNNWRNEGMSTVKEAVDDPHRLARGFLGLPPFSVPGVMRVRVG